MGRFAICIGVSSQQDTNLASIDHCARDAEAFADFLTKNGRCQSTVIVDPPSHDVRKKIWSILKNLTSSDQVVIFLSGHGRRSKARKLHFCLIDTYLSDLPSTSLPFDALIEMVKEAEMSATLIIIDCCYSGAAERSLLIKGNDDTLDVHEDIIREASGLSVLTSTNSVDVSLAYRQHSLSMFTEALIKNCLSLIAITTGWITVARLYENLKFDVAGHSPKLIGENPIFPICKGRATDLCTPTTCAVHFHNWNGTYVVFVGVLLIRYVRAWLLIAPKTLIPHDATQLTDDVYVLYNRQEAFKNKITGAEKRLLQFRTQLLKSTDCIGSPLLILFPIEIEENAFNRYSGIDRKYIFKISYETKKGYYIPASSGSIYSISELSGSYSAFHMPGDYLKEMLGVELIHEDGDLLRLDESMLSRNRKVLMIEPNTNRVVGIIVTGSEQTRQLRIFRVHSDLEAQIAESDRASVGRIGATFEYTPVSHWKLEDEKNAPLISLRTNQLRLTGCLIETEFQKQKKLGSDVPLCSHCMDEHEQVVEYNLRRYRIPCVFCSSENGQSWRAFWRPS